MSKKDPNNHVLIGQVTGHTRSVVYQIGVDKKISGEHNHAHFTCTCPAFKFSGKGGKERHCKHTELFTDDMDSHFLINLTHLAGENCEKVLQKILGWELNFSIRPHFAFVKRINPPTFAQVILALTEIVCPRIMCSHVMRGIFKINETQICEKCQRGFMP
jgi:hypothetical protein